jgi:hypothetical protein
MTPAGEQMRPGRSAGIRKAANERNLVRRHSLETVGYSGMMTTEPSIGAWSARNRVGALSNAVEIADPRVSSTLGTRQDRTVGARNSWPIFLFVIGLLVPWLIFVGPLRLSAYRIVLLVMLVPCLFTWISGRAGQVRLADIALMMFSVWTAISLVVVHGLATALQPAGIGFVETMGAYLLARCYVRNAEDFRNVVQLLFRTVLFLFPFAVIEFLTGYNILRTMLGMILPIVQQAPISRSGFVRVSSVFEHPILFGTYVGSIFGMVYLALGYQKDLVRRAFLSSIVAAAAFMSLSSGPIGAMMMQVFLIGWKTALRGVAARWALLIGLIVCLVVALEIVAKRSALTIITSLFMFDAQTYWYRTLIWTYGSATALNHPIFGVGLNDWERPVWMPSDTIDNFWLVQAVRYGLPAAFLLLLTFFSIVLTVGFAKVVQERIIEYRMGFMTCMVFLFITGCTVDFWNANYVFFFFLMGSGLWILDSQGTCSEVPGEAQRGAPFGGRATGASRPQPWALRTPGQEPHRGGR